MIYHKRFCYYSDVCQNVQWLIEEKVGCWVAHIDRAVVMERGVADSNPARLYFLIHFFFVSNLKGGGYLMKSYK